MAEQEAKGCVDEFVPSGGDEGFGLLGAGLGFFDACVDGFAAVGLLGVCGGAVGFCEFRGYALDFLPSAGGLLRRCGDLLVFFQGMRDLRD